MTTQTTDWDKQILRYMSSIRLKLNLVENKKTFNKTLKTSLAFLPFKHLMSKKKKDMQLRIKKKLKALIVIRCIKKHLYILHFKSLSRKCLAISYAVQDIAAEGTFVIILGFKPLQNPFHPLS